MPHCEQPQRPQKCFHVGYGQSPRRSTWLEATQECVDAPIIVARRIKLAHQIPVSRGHEITIQAGPEIEHRVGIVAAGLEARAAVIAVGEGAGEIDMVMAFGALRSEHAAVVAADIETVVCAVPGMPVKVILETNALSDSEKTLACRIVCDAGSRFVKTTTGFHASGGATVADVQLLRAAVGIALGVKAAGGIRSLTDARAMIGAGANRIGTSASAAILAAVEPSS